MTQDEKALAMLKINKAREILAKGKAEREKELFRKVLNGMGVMIKVGKSNTK